MVLTRPVHNFTKLCQIRRNMGLCFVETCGFQDIYRRIIFHFDQLYLSEHVTIKYATFNKFATIRSVPDYGLDVDAEIKPMIH